MQQASHDGDRLDRVIVVKVGSAVLAENGELANGALARLVVQAKSLRERGRLVVLVVSGAVAAGYRLLGVTEPPADVVGRQAAASVGQPKLVARLGSHFHTQGAVIAQILLSADDIEDRRRFLSARHTLHRLLESRVIPVINENDAVSDDEVKVGDNDHLSALVAQLISAELLVLLTSSDGIREDGGSGSRIPLIEADASVEQHLADERTATGVGGMRAKLSAARLASRYGIATVIADGRDPDVLAAIADGKDVGSRFPPRAHGLTSRKRWIAVRSRSRGALRVDGGAERALLHRGASLLPGGVIAVEGEFTRGARVEIQDGGGRPFAVGLASYPSREIVRMCGRRAEEFEAVLGYRYVDEIVHRDDLVLLGTDRDQEIRV